MHSLKIMAFILIAVLGLFSSVMSAILAAIILVEMVNALPISRKSKIDLTVIACFSIGLGAAPPYCDQRALIVRDLEKST